MYMYEIAGEEEIMQKNEALNPEATVRLQDMGDGKRGEV